MRQEMQQIPLGPSPINHQHSRELDEISSILDREPEIGRLATRDLVGDKRADVGRSGLTGEQVVRAAVIKVLHGFSYVLLAFHLIDSTTFRRFARLPFGVNPKPSTLGENIKKLSAVTWEAINRVVVGFAKGEKIENGRKMRGDTTVVEANIHHPSDSSLLADCVRVLARLLSWAVDDFPGHGIRYHDHTRRAKRRAYEIAFHSTGKGKKRRIRSRYVDLLEVTRRTCQYAHQGVSKLKSLVLPDPFQQAWAVELAQQLEGYVHMAERVIDQTERRVLRGEQVPAADKIFSIFEPHTDIIIKDNRDIYFGHKITLTGGASSMILDCVIERGNPADSTLVKPLLERHHDLFGRYPRQVAFDGGFASKDNLKWAKARGIKDVMFHKKRGLTIDQMTASAWIFKRLRNFRAGIEGCISTLKRAFGLGRCTWRGEEGFDSYVWASVVSYNLVVLARKLMARRAQAAQATA